MTSVFDDHAKDYSKDINASLGKFGARHDFFMAHKAKVIRSLASQWQMELSQSSLLDVGCGTGMLHSHVAADFAEVTGVDVSQPSLEVAAKANPMVNYRHYEGNKLPFDDQTFQVSLAVGVFHHVEPKQWDSLAAEMLRVLKPGGWSLVIEHSPYNPVTRHIVNTCDLDADAVLLKPYELRKLFRDAGGKNISTRTLLTVPPKNDFLFSVDKWLGKLPFGAQYYAVAQKG